MWAIQQYGFEAVISPRFGDIFRNNCTKNGLIPAQIAAEAAAELMAAVQDDPDLEITVDVERLAVEAPAIGFEAEFPLEASTQQQLPRRPRRHRYHAAPHRRHRRLRATTPPLAAGSHLAAVRCPGPLQKWEPIRGTAKSPATSHPSIGPRSVGRAAAKGPASMRKTLITTAPASRRKTLTPAPALRRKTLAIAISALILAAACSSDSPPGGAGISGSAQPVDTPDTASTTSTAGPEGGEGTVIELGPEDVVLTARAGALRRLRHTARLLARGVLGQGGPLGFRPRADGLAP